MFCSGPVRVDDETGQCVQPISGPKADVWAFGIILLELLLVSSCPFFKKNVIVKDLVGLQTFPLQSSVT